MSNLLKPGYVRFDGSKFVTDDTIQLTGPAGPPGPIGLMGPAGPPGSGNIENANVDAVANTLSLRDGYGQLRATSFLAIETTTPTIPVTGWSIYTDINDGYRLKAINSFNMTALLITTMRVTNTKNMNGNNTTTHLPLFQITGAIRVTKLYGIVTSTIGTNHTGSSFVLSDGTNNISISATATNPLSNAPMNSLIAVLGSTTTPTSVIVSNLPAIGEPSPGLLLFQEFGALANVSLTNVIGYNYTTTDTPTSGQIEFFIEFEPISTNATVIAI